MRYLLAVIISFTYSVSIGQVDTIPSKVADSTTMAPLIGYQDTTLRIMNLNPFFTLHVDSILNYDFIINRNNEEYFWFLVNSPVGVRIDRNTGQLYVKAEKALFRNGRLKYDIPYKVQLGVQNLRNPTDRVDTSFTLLFYSTEVVTSKLKPTTASVINLEEGDSVQFRIQCDEGTFPIEQITVNSSIPLSNYTPVTRCDDQFKWYVPFGIFRDNDTAKVKTVTLEFIGADKFYNRDTSVVRIHIRPGINYPVRNQLHRREYLAMFDYIKQLKLTFYVVSSSVKKTKSTRTTFDITGSSTALAGTVVSTTAERGSGAEQVGKILPSIGLTLVPVKEAVAPNKVQEQNTATQVRAEVRRLEFVLTENQLNGDRDPDVLVKTKRLQDEMKKSRLQFVDLPIVEYDERFSEEDADKYFKDPKVNKKYKLKVN
ncbi:MAG TPA: hypothetical protein VK907_03640 [Phnomibacter sp.]|nr:hypothetical protein [Phnomibacter sp.]